MGAGRERIGPKALVPASIIVIGAGPAGCLVTRRLADAGHEVILVEAGPGKPIPKAIRGPDWFDALNEPGWIWPDLLASRVEGRAPSPYLRGRGLGGCSAVNAMIALAGPVADLTQFANPRAQHQVLADIEPQSIPLGPLARSIAASEPVESAELLLSIDESGQRIRTSAYDLYLAGREDQFELRVNSEVARLVVTSGRRVTGIELVSGEVLSADRVVVCAGAIESPVLLLRSDVLNPHVGVGLKDHPAIPFSVKLAATGAVGTPAATGLVTWSSGDYDPRLRGHRDDLQLLILEHLGGPTGGSDGSDESYGQIVVALMDVESSGSIRLDGNDEPIINFDMLSSRADRVRLRQGVRRVLAMLDSGALEEVSSGIFVDEHGSSVDTIPRGESASDDDALDEWMSEHLGPYVHAACSCRLDAAVGHGGVLRGWQGINIIDASVLPIMPRANTQLPTMMLAETLVGDLLVLLNNF